MDVGGRGRRGRRRHGGGRGGGRGRNQGRGRAGSGDVEFEQLKANSIIFCYHCTNCEDDDWISGFKNLVRVFRHHHWDPTELQRPASQDTLSEEAVDMVLRGVPQRISSVTPDKRAIITPHFYYCITALSETLLERHLTEFSTLVKKYCLPREVPEAPQDPELSVAMVCLLNWLKNSVLIPHFDTEALECLENYDDAFRLEPIFPTEEEITKGVLNNIDTQYNPNYRSSFQGHLLLVL